VGHDRPALLNYANGCFDSGTRRYSGDQPNAGYAPNLPFPNATEIGPACRKPNSEAGAEENAGLSPDGGESA
jgi:hypothetical protein